MFTTKVFEIYYIFCTTFPHFAFFNIFALFSAKKSEVFKISR